LIDVIDGILPDGDVGASRGRPDTPRGEKECQKGLGDHF
jgi:hypothetical protein